MLNGLYFLTRKFFDTHNKAPAKNNRGFALKKLIYN